MQQEQIDLGHKRTCPHCGAKYYDFYQDELECPQCGKSNFAKRNECFGCGRSKRVGGPKQRGHHRKLKDPPPLHSAKYGKGNRRNRG